MSQSDDTGVLMQFRTLVPKLAAASVLSTFAVTALPVVDLPVGKPPAPSMSQEAPDRITAREAVIADETPFTVLGVTWRAGSAAPDTVVRVRYRVADTWTVWEELDVQGQPGVTERKAKRKAGAAVSRDGTEPLAAAGGTAYEIRVTSGSRMPKDIKALAIDASRTTLQTPPPGTARAEGSRPLVNGRPSWGADESKRTCDAGVAANLKAVAVHHTAGTNGYSAAQVPSMINGIYAFHTEGRGWCDIGYNVLVDRFGRLWEGRYGGLDRDIIPAAQEGFNTSTSAISAMGNFDTTAAPAAMVEAISRFASWRLGLGHVDPLSSTTLVSGGGSTTRYPEGTAVRLPAIFAHRNTGLTACPGDNIYAKMATIRSKARVYAGSAAIFNPTLNFWRMTTTDMPAFRINATTPSWQRFTLTVTRVATGQTVYQTSGSTYEQRFSAVWDKRTTSGQAVPAGDYVMRVVSSSTGANALPYATTVTVTGDAPPAGDPPPTDPTYRTPGLRDTSNRRWSTTCGPYSTATRCRVEFNSGTTWKLNNWSYFDQGDTAWSGNVLAKPGRWTSSGRSYSTTCSPSVYSGPRSCRTVVWNAATAQWVIQSMVWLGDGR